MMLREVPDHIRLDNGPESTARVVREWVDRVGARTLYIKPRSPWENGYIESFSGKLRDELLDREIFYTLLEVRVLTERYWPSFYSTSSAIVKERRYAPATSIAPRAGRNSLSRW